MAGEQYHGGRSAPNTSLVRPLHAMSPWDSANKETAPDTGLQLWTRNSQNKLLHNLLSLWHLVISNRKQIKLSTTNLILSLLVFS